MFNSFCICVLITVCALLTVPALIYKVLVYAGLNDLLTKLVWVRSSLLAFSGVLSPNSMCQFDSTFLGASFSPLLTEAV